VDLFPKTFFAARIGPPWVQTRMQYVWKNRFCGDRPMAGILAKRVMGRTLLLARALWRENQAVNLATA